MMTELTVPNEATEVEYTVVASSTGPFTIPFSFFDLDDIRVSTEDDDGVLTEFVNTTDFIVTGTAVDGGFDGGSLVMNAAQADVTLKVYRSVIIDRTNNYPITGPFDFALLNDELNKYAAIMQELDKQKDSYISLPQSSLASTPFSASDRAICDLSESAVADCAATNRQVDANGPNWLAENNSESPVGAALQWNTVFSAANIKIEGNDTTRFFDLMTQFFGFIQNRNSNQAIFLVRYRYQVDCYSQITKDSNQVYPIKIPGTSAFPFSFMDISQDIDYTNGNCTLSVGIDFFPQDANSADLFIQWGNLAINTSEPR